MFTKTWQKLTSHFRGNPTESVRDTGTKLGIPKSTVHDHQKRLAKRCINSESEFWESKSGQNFLSRLLVGAIYTFCIKGGVGAGRVEEFMDYLRVHTHAGVSESSIYRMMKAIEVSILKYKELVEQELQQRASEELQQLEVVLGLDETWLDDMLLVCQELSSGYLFFEQASEKRDAKSWWTPLTQVVQSYHLKIKMLVSDRATGLIKLGDTEYFGVCSMPDLFHFNQGLAQAVGAPLGKAWKKAKDALKAAAGFYFELKELEDNYLLLDNCRRKYQNGIHGIHKAVQPYNEDGSFTEEQWMRKAIITSISLIEKQAIPIEKEVQTKTVTKVIDQIPDLLLGVKQWQDWTVKRAILFTQEIDIEIREEELQKWLIHYLLPVFIWQLTLKRVPPKKKNERLIKYYKEIEQKARDKLTGSKLDNHMTSDQYEQCENWAKKVARTFQRSSSQVEGRNGYLAFIHKASRGMSDQRLKTLTVVHNFDTIGWDGKTPAERLFDREFPNLFEFVLGNVTAFPEPRRRKHKRLIASTVRA